MEQVSAALLDWAMASAPLPGGEELGDVCLVRELPGAAVVAVVDGLGHGQEAARAARQALELLERYIAEPPASALRRCHEGLRSTRGVVASVARFDAGRGTLTWIGVGNVMAVLQRSDARGRAPQESLLLGRGVVGRQLPPLRAAMLDVRPGDVLAMATDGIRPDFAPGVRASAEPPQRIADRILAEHQTGTDEALVAVVRYRGVDR